tara:strand:- start:170 stop:796 length:627 start_codon:yes stop_codon:yes gene_type:complete
MNKHYYYKTQQKTVGNKVYEKVNHKPIVDFVKGVELIDLGYTTQDILSYARVQPFVLENLKKYQLNKEAIMSKAENPIHRKELLHKLALGISLPEIYSEFLEEVKAVKAKAILCLEQGKAYLSQGITLVEIQDKFRVPMNILIELQKFAIKLNIIQESKVVDNVEAKKGKSEVSFTRRMNESMLRQDPIGWEIRQLFNSNSQLREFAM